MFELDPTIIKVTSVTAGTVCASTSAYGVFRWASGDDDWGPSLIAGGILGFMGVIVLGTVLTAVSGFVGETSAANEASGVNRPGAPRVSARGVDSEGKFAVAFKESVYVENRQGLKMGTAAHGAFNLQSAEEGGNLVRFGAPGGMDIDGGEVTFTGFIFTQGATIEDGDGNTASHSFEPYLHDAAAEPVTSNAQAFSKGGAY